MGKALWRILLVVCLVFGTVAIGEGARKRTVDKARKELDASKRKVKETQRKIKANEEQTRRNLQQLRMLEGEIYNTTREIGRTRLVLDSLGTDIRHANDSLISLNTRLTQLKANYIKALRRLQGTQYADNPVAFMLASETFTKAAARLRYFHEFGRWYNRRVRDISNTTNQIAEQRESLSQLHQKRSASLDSLSTGQRKLESKQHETDAMVSKLKKDRKSLERALAKEQQRLKQINNDISRMIAQEEADRRKQQDKKDKKSPEKSGKDVAKNQGGKQQSGSSKPQDKPRASSRVDNSDPDQALTNRFSQARGSMPFPVTGSYTIVSRYGRNVDPATGLSTSNTGIEVVTGGGSSVRAVYDGTVSRIFQTREGPYAVMIRHGAYITVYYNLESLTIKQGDRVSKGQTIGRAAIDPHNGNRPMLHFEVRKGSSTLDPMGWVK